MKKILFMALGACVLTLASCTPKLASRPIGDDEKEWSNYIQSMYPGWEQPATLPQAVTLSSKKVPYTHYVDADNVVMVDEITVTDLPQDNGIDGEFLLEESTPVDDAQSLDFTEYVVVKGDTLSGIAKKVYGNGKKYYNIFKANDDVMKDPNHLYPGMKLKIPKL